MGIGWWRWEDLNLRQRAYETPALPLSYTATRFTIQQLRSPWQSGSPHPQPQQNRSVPAVPLNERIDRHLHNPQAPPQLHTLEPPTPTLGPGIDRPRGHRQDLRRLLDGDQARLPRMTLGTKVATPGLRRHARQGGPGACLIRSYVSGIYAHRSVFPSPTNGRSPSRF